MRGHLDAGVSAAEAARLALAGRESRRPDEAHAGRLATACGGAARGTRPARRGRGPRARSTGCSRPSRSRPCSADVLLPYLRELGERWERGEASVAQEHFASNVLRGRLLGLARGWGRGAGPAGLLACAPGEQHDLPLIAFGLALRAAAGGSPTSAPTRRSPRSTRRSRARPAALVVIAAIDAGAARVACSDELAELARGCRVGLAGAGANEDVRHARWARRSPRGRSGGGRRAGRPSSARRPWGTRPRPASAAGSFESPSAWGSPAPVVERRRPERNASATLLARSSARRAASFVREPTATIGDRSCSGGAAAPSLRQAREFEVGAGR